MNKYFSILLMFLVLNITHSIYGQQASLIELTALRASFRSLDQGENQYNLVSVYDTAYQNKKIQLDLMMSFSSTDNLSSVELRQGQQSGDDNIARVTLTYTVRDSVPGFEWKTRFFPIVNNTVFIEVLVPYRFVIKTTYIWARAKDINGSYSQIRTQKFN